MAYVWGARPDRANYIARHWRGDLSLPVSYWVNGYLIGIGYIVGTAFFIAYQPRPSITYTIGPLIMIALGLAITVWQLIGVWRSAGKHKERGGRRIWANLAQVSVVLGWLSFIKEIFKGIFELFGGVPGS